ncbi:hypothetical protein MIR68_002559 [Amoeboaphelidium protococcarum]|nr:hypothetical protein MIR68_002559 [Amoeboaphelidium protococcarum]
MSMFKILRVSAVAIPLLNFVSGHSHLECTDAKGPGQCAGYPRYYSHYKQGYEGSDESKDRNFIVAAGAIRCPTAPADSGQMYTTNYPMAKWMPGSTVVVQWPPRGHLQQKHSDVWIYCSTDASSAGSKVDEQAIFSGTPGDESLTSSAATTTSGASNNATGGMELIATTPYDNCNGSDVSWAKCTGQVQVPSTWQQGEIRSCMFAWTLNDAQQYIDCFEVQVGSGGLNVVASNSSDTQDPRALLGPSQVEVDNSVTPSAPPSVAASSNNNSAASAPPSSQAVPPGHEGHNHPHNVVAPSPPTPSQSPSEAVAPLQQTQANSEASVNAPSPQPINTEKSLEQKLCQCVDNLCTGSLGSSNLCSILKRLCQFVN